MTLPTWMTKALFATAAMNLLAVLAFLPSGGTLRELAGLPAGEHPLYLSVVALFVLLFGLGYLRSAIVGHADGLFIALAAAGKISFVGLLVWFWASGELSFRAPLVASPDLVFGGIFLKWLWELPSP